MEILLNLFVQSKVLLYKSLS
ncbi:unnamed protein product, partial [Mesorhabditis belari]|uniref:Uncharacterized protein n=1 Tax=Mesorhabditis belari TaxID=2138241 RepID=A0AAF3FNH6_9BILA